MKKYMLVVDSEGMALMNALMPRVQYIEVDGLEFPEVKDCVVLVNPRLPEVENADTE